MTRTEFFEALANGAKWNVGVSIARINPLPLDVNSVFESLEALDTYVKTNPLAYPGQLVSVIGEDELSAYHITSVGESGVYTKLAASTASGDLAADVASLQSKVGTLTSDLDALEAAVGTVTPGKTVVEMIADAQAAATYDDTELAGRVTTVENTVTTLVGEDTSKSARTIASEEVAKIVAGADASYDTLKEIADWISSHKTDATAMNSAITALEGIVDGIGGEGEKATVVAYVTDAIEALKIGDYAKAADLTTLAGRVTELENVGAQANVIESIKVNGTVQDITDKAVDISVPTRLNQLEGYTALTDDIAKKVDAVAGKSLVDDTLVTKLSSLANIKTVSSALTISEQGQLDIASISPDKVTGLEALIEEIHSPIATDALAGLVMANPTENGVDVAVDGKMSVHSVNVNKLVQTDGEELILNGGNAGN